MTCAEHYACDCFQAEAQYHRDRIEALTAQVEANRARYESARRERDTMAAVIRGVAQNFRRLGQDREADGLLALAGLGT